MALLWGIRYLLNLVLSLFSVSALGVSTVPQLLGGDNVAAAMAGGELFTLLVAVGCVIVTVWVHSISYALIGTVWTLAVNEIVAAARRGR